MLLKSCPCRTCKHFHPVEGIDYEDTGNGHVVYCEDGKVRFVDMEQGCGYYEEECFIEPCEVKS